MNLQIVFRGRLSGRTIKTSLRVCRSWAAWPCASTQRACPHLLLLAYRAAIISDARSVASLGRRLF
jgi:hypothetical protein